MPPVKPGDTAVSCEIVSVDPAGQSITCAMPSSLKGGTYNLWVSNEYGTSVTNQLNTARPQWLSESSVAPGMSIKVIGKNMTSAAYSDGNKSYAALVGDDEIYNLELSSANEFAIEFVCPENVLQGEYDVYVTNDKYVWNKPEDGVKLTVTAPVNDVYDIGAAWVGEFDYDTQFNVQSILFGATANDDTDDTEAFKKAISVAELVGGGVIYIPEGSYNITELEIGSNIILAGDGMDKTVLNCLGTSYTSWGWPVIEMSDGYNGIYGLTLREAEGIDSPDEYIIMTDHSFLKNFKLDVPLVPDEDTTPDDADTGEGRGIGVLIGGDGYSVIDGCEFSGYDAEITHSAPRDYIRVSNCNFNTAVGVLGATSAHVVFENNTVNRVQSIVTETATNTSGIFTRGPSYLFNNTITNLGKAENDGEIMCAENYQGGIKLAGEIVEAASNQVTVSIFDDISGFTPDWNLSESGFNQNYLVITAGRGAGQYSPITAYSEEDGTITIERPFDVLPNKDSIFAVMPLSENVTMYKNNAENARKGYWLYYDCVDSVIADNTGINTEGALIRSVYSESDESYANTVCFFNRIEGNYFEGNSVMSNILGVSATVAVHGTNPINMNIYGVEIKDNTVICDENAKEVVDYSEAPLFNGISVVFFCDKQNTEVYPVLKQVIIDSNIVKNSDSGLIISDHDGRSYRQYATGDMTSEVIIGNNFFENVDTEITDNI